MLESCDLQPCEKIDSRFTSNTRVIFFTENMSVAYARWEALRVSLPYSIAVKYLTDIGNYRSDLGRILLVLIVDNTLQ